MKHIISALISSLWLLLLLPQQATCDFYFNRVSFFPVCKQLDTSCRTDNTTNSEIVDVSKDGMTLVYGDYESGSIGFVDIRDPFHPTPLGLVDVGGEPTSVAVNGDYAIVGVNTSPDYVNVSGILHVVHMETKEVLRTMDLEGQPDSVGVSPDGRFVVIAIENERDEDLVEVDGGLPQLPAGFLQVLSSESEDVMDWSLTTIELAGLEGLVEAEDPEPEFVHINENNICVVTLQENNGIVLVDLESMEVTASFSAGVVDLSNVDVKEDGVIYQNASHAEDVPREPDGVVWIGTDHFATADEGDWNGGSRGFTIYDTDGNVVWSSGDELEVIATQYGHYPEERSENKGNEPENIEYGVFGEEKILFINSERSSLIFVYEVSDVTAPVFKQALPAGYRPEGGKAIPGRNLYVVASEEDARGDKVRAGITIYQWTDALEYPVYPTLVSDDMEDGNPIPFSALSGLAAKEPFGLGIEVGKRGLMAMKRGSLHQNKPEQVTTNNVQQRGLRTRKLDGEVPTPPGLEREPEGVRLTGIANPFGSAILYSCEDSFYKKNRIFEIDTTPYPHRITKAMRITDANGVFASALGDGEMKDSLINNDNTVNIDPEGISVSSKGGFWLVHEGSGTVGDEARPVKSPNVLFKLNDDAIIEQVILLPDEQNEIQLRFGFEGVAEDGDHVVVAFQRAWGGNKDPYLGIYNTATEEWKFVFYPLGQPESQNGGWVGLSDIAPTGSGTFMVLERDNQGGEDAAIKRLFSIDLGDFSLKEGTTIEKEFYLDLIPSIAAFRGAFIEKVEGLAVTAAGNIWINTDNDGVDDNSGEQLLIQVV